MRLAVIGDIHSNVYALRSVLQDIKNRNVDGIIGTGDLVGYLPYPNEVIELFKENNIVSVQGNHDAVIGGSVPVTSKSLEGIDEKELQGNASRLYTNMIISQEYRNYLKYLPTSIKFEVAGKRVLVVHGSPASQKEYLLNDEELLKMWSRRIAEDILICGHTHEPYVNKVQDKIFINAGSVGKSKHGNENATYAILTIEDEVNCEIVEVAYDKTELYQKIKSEPLISDDLIDMLQKGY